jgi:hypothetical protein
MRKKLRKDKVEPRLTKSSTDKDAPKRVMPYIDSVDPTRIKDRNDSEDPKVQKSSTDIDEPRSAIPKMDIADPRRM